MENTYQWSCRAPNCNKKCQYRAHKYCPMHMARLRRNGTLKTQKEMGIIYNPKLGTLSEGQLDYIKKNADQLLDREIAEKFGVHWYVVRYARRKIFGRKYKGLNGRTYLIQRYREMNNDICQVCGWNEGSCDIHHKLPLSHGGKHELDNLICVCPNHHRIIHEKGLEFILS